MKRNLFIIAGLVIIVIIISLLLSSHKRAAPLETDPLIETPFAIEKPTENPEPSVEELTLPEDVLTGTSWQWNKTAIGADGFIVPAHPEKFILTFRDDGRISSSTDCNRMFGPYNIDNTKLSIGPLASTLMFCEGSQEAEYSKVLQDTESFTLSTDGNVLTLIAGETVMIMEKAVTPVTTNEE